MIITEKHIIESDIDADVICDYFQYLEEIEEERTPSIDGLMSFINDFYYNSDFTTDIYSYYDGDNTSLLEMYNEFKNND